MWASTVVAVPVELWLIACSLRRRAVRTVLPVLGVLTIAYWMLLYGGSLFQGDAQSTAVRLTYMGLYAYAMEFVARYSHRYLWHSGPLWWLHGTHHHQYPKIGAPPRYDHSNTYVTPIIELNDVFPLFFGTIAVALLAYGSQWPNTLSKDCWSGMALGTTAYGLSYFTGHDIVTHERLGKGVARFLRSKWSYLDQCAEVHNRYHHKLKKQQGDPYGPPYGFWLGPSEIEALRKGSDYAPMPRPVRAALQLSLLVALGASSYTLYN